MSRHLPAEVIVTELSDGVRYRLPLRPRGSFVWMGSLQVFGGLIGVAFLSFWIYAAGCGLFWGRRPGEPLDQPGGMSAAFMLCGVGMLGAVLWFTAQGVTRLIGHSEIELRGDTLRGLECWGPLRWGWRRSVAGLARFDVRDATMEKDSVRAYDSPGAAMKYNVIAALWETGPENEKTNQLAWGYPRSWLVPLAQELAARCQISRTEGSASTKSRRAVAVTEEALPNLSGFVEALEQPADSKIEVEELASGGRQSPEALLRGLTSPARREGAADKLATLKITVPFHSPRRRAVLTVAGDVLSVEQKKEQHTWARQQLVDIRVGRIIEHEGPDTPLLLIQPHPGEGELFRLPMQLQNEDETRWLATKLRRALRFEETHWDEPGGAFVERTEQPAGSPIVLERFGANLILTVPPGGIWGSAAQGYVVSALIAAIVAAVITSLWCLFPNSALLQTISGPFLIFLGLVELVSLACAIPQAKQRAVFQVLDDVLVVQTTVFRTTEQRWRRAGIADIRVGYHMGYLVKTSTIRGTVIDQGNLPWELQIHRENGDVVGVLAGRAAEELQWLATLLRHALDLPKHEIR
jgi:hypothetical protein